MGKYSTISIPAEVKRILEEVKGDGEWGEFLPKLCMEAKRLKARETFNKLAKILTEKELNDILESSREFREGFELR